MTRRSEDEPRLVDARGLKCPWPVLRVARVMRECEAILLLADDPVALIDVPALAEAHGWSLVSSNRGSHHDFQLSKTGR